MKAIYSLTLILALLLSSCTDRTKSAPPLTRLDSLSTVLAFGDSLTEGKGAREENSYPSVLSSLTGISVINSGVSGETSARGKQRLAEELRRYNPDLLILCHGGNDMIQRLDLSSAKANLKEMIEMAQNRGAQVVLIGVPEASILLKPSNKASSIYEQLAAEYNLPYESQAIPRLLADAKYRSDAVHLNAAGYAELAKSLHQMLIASGALAG